MNDVIARAVVGHDALEQAALDAKLLELDGTANKEKLGANAILGVSMAVARTAAASRKLPLYRYLGGVDATLLPAPMLNGGAHADNSVDFQEFMIAPVGAPSFREAMRWATECYQALKSTLKSKGLGTGVGDEGGFAPNLKANVEAIEVILTAIAKAGFAPGKDVVLALDPAASEFYEDGRYVLAKSDKSRKTSAEMVAFWADWVRQYPIWSIEDGLAEQDWDGWRLLTEKLGKQIKLVGDDIFVTNSAIVREAIQKGIANSVLIKLNQIGTVTETLDCMRLAWGAGYGTVVSHRSGRPPMTSSPTSRSRPGPASSGRARPAVASASRSTISSSGSRRNWETRRVTRVRLRSGGRGAPSWRMESSRARLVGRSARSSVHPRARLCSQ